MQISFYTKIPLNLVRLKYSNFNESSGNQVDWFNKDNQSGHLKDFRQIFNKFTAILNRKCVNHNAQCILELLYDKYVKKTKYLEQKQPMKPQEKKSEKDTRIAKSKTRQSTVSIIDLSDKIQEQSRPRASRKNKNPPVKISDQIIVVEENHTEETVQSKEDYLFPTKTIQKQTGRAFYLLDDPFTPKIYKESLVEDYIDFRNQNFSDTMPVSRAQQRKSENQQKSMQQKFTYTRDILPDENSQRYKRALRPPLQSEPLWKNRIKPDSSYMSSLAEVWTLEENCMSKKKELIKRFHEEREAAKLLINCGYGIKTVRHKLDLFDNKRLYHKRAYAIVKQAFRCIEEDLIEKYQKTIKPLTLNIFRKVMCFLAHYHDSFSKEEEKKQLFSQYIKIAYLIDSQSPGFQESAQLYNFILKDVLPEDEYDDRIIHID